MQLVYDTFEIFGTLWEETSVLEYIYTLISGQPSNNGRRLLADQGNRTMNWTQWYQSLLGVPYPLTVWLFAICEVHLHTSRPVFPRHTALEWGVYRRSVHIQASWPPHLLHSADQIEFLAKKGVYYWADLSVHRYLAQYCKSTKFSMQEYLANLAITLFSLN